MKGYIDSETGMAMVYLNSGADTEIASMRIAKAKQLIDAVNDVSPQGNPMKPLTWRFIRASQAAEELSLAVIRKPDESDLDFCVRQNQMTHSPLYQQIHDSLNNLRASYLTEFLSWEYQEGISTPLTSPSTVLYTRDDADRLQISVSF